MKESDFQKLIDLGKRRDELRAVWYRHMLTLAAGGLAVLAGLDPRSPEGAIPRCLLAATWVLLGSGIVSGAAATFLDAHLAARLATAFQSRLRRDMEREKRGGGADAVPVVAKPVWGYRIARMWMVLSLLGAVVCFTGFAAWRTLVD